MLDRETKGSEAPLYQEPLGEYLRGQGVMLFAALGVLVMGFILLARFILIVSGIVAWTSESESSDLFFMLMTPLILIGSGLWVLHDDILVRRRFAVTRNEIKLACIYKAEKSGTRRKALRPDEIIGVKLQLDAFSDMWKLKIYLTDEDEYIISDDSEELLMALKGFFRLNGITLTTVEEPVYDHWGKRLA